MKNNKKLVIWGASGHASVIVEIIKLCRKYEIIGFIDNINKDKNRTTFLDIPILGDENQLDNIIQNGVKYIIFGFGNCQEKLILSRTVEDRGFRLASAIHPKSVISENSRIQPGSVIMAGAIINNGVIIGKNVIINTNASIDHHCQIGEASHISPGVNMAGDVIVGKATWIGIGATIIEKVRIGSNSIIGAGSVVLRDIPDGVVAYGVPARVIRKI